MYKMQGNKEYVHKVDIEEVIKNGIFEKYIEFLEMTKRTAEIKTNSVDKWNDRLDAFEGEFYELGKIHVKLLLKAIRKDQEMENKKERLRDEVQNEDS